MASLAVAFDILARDRASKEFDKVGNSIDKAGKKGAAFGKIAGGVIAAGIGALAVTLKTGLSEVSDYQAGLSQLQAGIKSTGNVAGVSSKGLEDLATSIQGYSGQTDDSIVASEKLLLTFTNIRNSAGKNNDIFNQATKATADLAARMGGDASTNAIRLGKALNDPVKGVTALQRIGISFTESQKKTIASLVKTGDVAGAQKLILAELNREVGGSAAAYGKTLPGQVDRAKRSFEDVSQNLVTALLPALTKMVDVINKDFIPAFKSTVDFFTRNKRIVVPLAVAIGGLAAAVYVLNTAAKIYAATQAALNIVLEANPIGLVVVGIAALAAGLVLAYKHSQTFRDIVKGAFDAVGTAGTSLWEDVLKPAFKFIEEAFLTVAGTLVHGAASAFGWIPGLGGKLKKAAKAFDKFRDDVNASLDGVKDKTVKINVKLAAGGAGKIIQARGGKFAVDAPAGRAYGGPVSAGVPYIVGENEPELFVPGQSGRIFNQKQLAGLGRGGNTYHIYAVAGPNENAADSVPRALRNHAFLLGQA